jgi:nucleoid DNA-binding protein
MGQSKVAAKQRVGRNNPLALVLVDLGCSYRLAQKITNTVFDEIKAALKRHEVVELPFGTFRVVETPQQEHRRWRFGQPQAVFRRRYRVVFEPSERMTSGQS